MSESGGSYNVQTTFNVMPVYPYYCTRCQRMHGQFDVCGSQEVSPQEQPCLHDSEPKDQLFSHLSCPCPKCTPRY